MNIDLESSSLSHQAISQMLQTKIADMESSKKRQENAAWFDTKNAIVQELTTMKEQYENKENLAPDTEAHRQELYTFIARVNNIFYDVLEENNKFRLHASNVVQQNDTLKRLCAKLQDDKKILTEHVQEMETREKQWKSSIEEKFQSSLQDIKDKIKDHEQRYNAVVEENTQLREQLTNFLEYDKKRSNDFELYKGHQGKLDELHEKEKENFSQMVDKERQQSLELATNLKQAMEVNHTLKERCQQYEDKFMEMGSTVKESSSVIGEYKKMNAQLMKQNKLIHEKLTSVMSKYKQLNCYNDELDSRYKNSGKRIETLSELCRKLQVKNKDLMEDVKMAKQNLLEQGVALQFKSDLSESKSVAQSQKTEVVIQDEPEIKTEETTEMKMEMETETETAKETEAQPDEPEKTDQDSDGRTSATNAMTINLTNAAKEESPENPNTEAAAERAAGTDTDNEDTTDQMAIF